MIPRGASLFLEEEFEGRSLGEGPCEVGTGRRKGSDIGVESEERKKHLG